MALTAALRRGPRVGRYLLRDEGEVIVDEVGKHWVLYLLPALELVLAALAILTTITVLQRVRHVARASGYNQPHTTP